MPDRKVEGSFATPVSISGDEAGYLQQIIDQLALVVVGAAVPRALVSTVGSTSANWNTGTGTSGESGDDLVTIGANNTNYMLHSLMLDVSACTNGAVLSIKLFSQINGVERKVYDQDFTVNTAPDGLWIVDGSLGIHEALRVEVESDTNENVAISYDYGLETMA